MKKQTIIEAFAGLLILLFVYTGLYKILTPSIMIMDFHKPEQPELIKIFATPLAYIIPLSELIISGLLLFSKYRKLGFYGGFILMTIFTIYVGYILFTRPLTIQRPCTCGGIIRYLTWETHFVVNIIFIAVALTGIILERKKQRTQSELESLRYNISL